MKVKAIHRNAAMGPRKLRQVGRMLAGMPVGKAQAQLAYLPSRKAAALLSKLLRSAVANAKQQYDLDESGLKVGQIMIDKGIALHRFQPVSKGMAHPIKKQFSHITLWVESQQRPKKKKAATKADIVTLGASQYAAQKATEDHHDHDEHDHGEPLEDSKDAVDTGRATAEPDVEIQEAYQKSKMQQQGGNRKKSFRRKSI